MVYLCVLLVEFGIYRKLGFDVQKKLMPQIERQKDQLTL